jgi:hypothetical protein
VNVPIADAEWNFQALLETEVFPCEKYEFWREAAEREPDFVPRLHRIRDKIEKGETPNQISGDLLSEDFIPLEFVMMSHWLDYFPRTPFLKIPAQKRQQVLSFESRTSSVACIPIDWPISLLHRGLLRAHDFAPFQINWDFKDDKMVEDFARWLKDNRPKNRPGRATYPTLKTSRTRLKHLAAYRLSRAMRVLDAISYTEEKCKKSLFASPQSWSRAETRAKTLIKKFVDRARQ